MVHRPSQVQPGTKGKANSGGSSSKQEEHHKRDKRKKEEGKEKWKGKEEKKTKQEKTLTREEEQKQLLKKIQREWIPAATAKLEAAEKALKQAIGPTGPGIGYGLSRTQACLIAERNKEVLVARRELNALNQKYPGIEKPSSFRDSVLVYLNYLKKELIPNLKEKLVVAEEAQGKAVGPVGPGIGPGLTQAQALLIKNKKTEVSNVGKELKEAEHRQWCLETWIARHVREFEIGVRHPHNTHILDRIFA